MYTHTCIEIYTHKVHVCSNNNHIVHVCNQVFSPRLGTGLFLCRVAVIPLPDTSCQGCAKSSGSSQLFYSRKAKPYKHTRQNVYNKSLFTHRVIPSTFHCKPLNISQSVAATLAVTNGIGTCQTLSILTAIHNNYKQIRGCHMSPSLSNCADTCQKAVNTDSNT